MDFFIGSPTSTGSPKGSLVDACRLPILVKISEGRLIDAAPRRRGLRSAALAGTSGGTIGRVDRPRLYWQTRIKNGPFLLSQSRGIGEGKEGETLRRFLPGPVFQTVCASRRRRVVQAMIHSRSESARRKRLCSPAKKRKYGQAYRPTGWRGVGAQSGPFVDLPRLPICLFADLLTC